MVNLKHAASAIAAVAMVGSLAAHQAADMTSVSAKKPDVKIQFKQPDILKGDGEGIVLDEIPAQTAKKAEVTETAADSEEAPKENEKGYVLITEAYLNLRAEPSTEAEVVSQLECAAEVTILADSDEWYQVQSGDKTGYVYKKFITNSYDEARAAMLENFKYESGYINADGVNIRDGAGTDGTNVIDQTDNGDLVFVIERANDEWIKVFYGKNYDVGYVKTEFVTIDDAVSKDDVAAAKINRINDISKKGVVSSDGEKLNVRTQPDEESEIIDSLSDGDAVRIITKGSKWTKIAVGNGGKTAYVKSEYILDEDQIAAREAAKKAEEEKKQQEAKKKEEQKKQQKKQQEKAAADAKKKQQQQAAKNTKTKTETKAASETSSAQSTGSGSGQAIVNAAKRYIGTRYVYGGNSPSTGFDCSGLVQYACRQAGVSVSRSSRAQYGNGTAVSRSNLQPGDLIFFSKGGGISHVVIYAGNGQVIHSPRPGKTVCYASLSTICSYSNYVGARRVAG